MSKNIVLHDQTYADLNRLRLQTALKNNAMISFSEGCKSLVARQKRIKWSALNAIWMSPNNIRMLYSTNIYKDSVFFVIQCERWN